MKVALSAHVRALSAPEMGGRGPDSAGLERARDYVRAQFEAIGLEAAGEESYYSPVTVVASARRARAVSLKLGGRVLAPGAEFTARGMSDEVTLQGDLVFVGYGLSLPQHGWDEYDGIELRGKIALVLTGGPATSRFSLADEEEYLLELSSKAAVAYAKGARAVLFVNDPRSHGAREDQRADELPEMSLERPLTGVGVGHVTARAAQRALAGAGYDLAALQQALDASATPASRGLDVSVKLTLGVERERVTAHNVIGMLPGSDPEAPPVIVGAHYDGLGFGVHGTLHRGEAELHPGADDNASGVGLLIEAARALSQLPLEDRARPILFVAFTGEELGLVGSRRFAASLGERARGARALTVDMVGRSQGRVLTSGEDLEGVEEAARAEQIALDAIASSHSDHIALRGVGVEVLHLTTGRHVDYHTPRDTEDRIDYEGLARITRFAVALIALRARAR